MRLTIRNFRAIQKEEIDLAPITVVYGANGAGKSSLLYALLTLKTAILNSNSATSAFFSYGFTSLGGFDAVVFDHAKSNKIELSLRTETESGGYVEHGVSFGEGQGVYKLAMKSGNFDVSADDAVPFPYPGNLPVTLRAPGFDPQVDVTFTWNGITAQAGPSLQLSPENLQRFNSLLAMLNAPAELLRKLSMVPLKRGFSKPVYQTQAVTPALISEEEVASFLSNNKYLESKISHYLERILNQDFRVHVQPGTAIFTLDATDRNTGISTELVNEGFGVNQMVYFLAKALNPESGWTCIEEPEIHLHPSAVRKFARAMNDIVSHEGKNFIVSTHSEAFVLSLLSLVAEKKVTPDQLAFYYVQKVGKKTKFERQTVHDNGQLEGGLTSFMGGELEDLKNLLKVSANS